ncbi:MAG: capsular biosynthesis protein, partial [Ruthenibacterium sp.]
AVPDKKWTFFTYDDTHGIVSIRDKAEDAEENAAPLPLFVGTLCFSQPSLLHSSLAAYAGIPSKTDSFWRAVQSYSEKVRMEYRFVSEWFDVGHSENYLRAKTGVEARMFNALQIDDKRGIMMKTSDNKEKFIQEIKWYLRLPEQLQYLAPRIYQYSVNPEHPYVSMEYYGYNTLHEMYLYGDLPLYRWQSIFEKLLFIVNDMGRYRVECESTETSAALREMYVTKTISRLLSLRGDSRFTHFFEQPVTVNGHQYPSLDTVMKQLPELLERTVIARYTGGFNIIHGDFHFSNILTEATYGFMRLVDPRGGFGNFDLYGDPRYEIAKLMHSLDGKYDFIIEDMFKIDVHDNSITYEVMEKPQRLYPLFREVFKDKMTDYRALKLIEATLFLSMLPLHSDAVNRQYAMLATGLRLLGEVAECGNPQEQ